MPSITSQPWSAPSTRFDRASGRGLGSYREIKTTYSSPAKYTRALLQFNTIYQFRYVWTAGSSGSGSSSPPTAFVTTENTSLSRSAYENSHQVQQGRGSITVDGCPGSPDGIPGSFSIDGSGPTLQTRSVCQGGNETTEWVAKDEHQVFHPRPDVDSLPRDPQGRPYINGPTFNLSGNSSVPQTEGYVTHGVNWNYLVEIKSLAVTITSDIETSWKKGSGSVFSLPAIYKARDADGNLLIQPNEKAVLVSPNTTDPSKNIWKLQCLRNGDGSMTVESAAKPKFIMGMNQQWDYHWYGGGSFTANTLGMVSPTLSWDVASNTNVYHGNPLVLVDYAHSDPFGPRTLRLGVGKSLPIRSTNVAVTATEGAATMSNNYMVNWHEPIENTQQVGAPIKTYTLTPSTVVNGYPTTMGVGDETKVILDPTTAKASLYLSNTEQMTVMVGWTVLFRGATVYVMGAEAGKMLTAGFLLKHFYNIEMKDAMDAPNYGMCKNTEQEWNRAVASTRDALNHVPNADIRISPSDIALEEPNDMRWLSSDMMPWTKRSSTTIFTKSDAYDHNGYLGLASGQVDSDDNVEIVGCFEFTGRPPIM